MTHPHRASAERTGPVPVRAVEQVPLRTADGVRLSAVMLRAPHRATGARKNSVPGVVLLPGFSGAWGRPGVTRVSEALARHADVLVVDLRGHGRSAGLTTLGDREVLDVDVAVGEMRRRGYRDVVTVGWSMGGSCAVRHAALVGGRVHDQPVQHPVDAVVAVSTAGWWWYRGTPAMRRLHLVVRTAPGRLVGRLLLKVRIDPSGWASDPLDPAGAAAHLTIPLLVVHGDRDGYLPLEHGRALVSARGEGGELWEVPGFGHAEEAADAALLDRIGAAIPGLVARGRVA